MGSAARCGRTASALHDLDPASPRRQRRVPPERPLEQPGFLVARRRRATPTLYPSPQGGGGRRRVILFCCGSASLSRSSAGEDDRPPPPGATAIADDGLRQSTPTAFRFACHLSPHRQAQGGGEVAPRSGEGVGVDRDMRLPCIIVGDSNPGRSPSPTPWSSRELRSLRMASKRSDPHGHADDEGAHAKQRDDILKELGHKTLRFPVCSFYVPYLFTSSQTDLRQFRLE